MLSRCASCGSRRMSRRISQQLVSHGEFAAAGLWLPETNAAKRGKSPRHCRSPTWKSTQKLGAALVKSQFLLLGTTVFSASGKGRFAHQTPWGRGRHPASAAIQSASKVQDIHDAFLRRAGSAPSHASPQPAQPPEPASHPSACPRCPAADRRRRRRHGQCKTPSPCRDGGGQLRRTGRRSCRPRQRRWKMAKLRRYASRRSGLTFSSKTPSAARSNSYASAAVRRRMVSLTASSAFPRAALAAKGPAAARRSGQLPAARRVCARN